MQKIESKSYGNTPNKSQLVNNLNGSSANKAFFSDNLSYADIQRLEGKVERPQYNVPVISNRIYDNIKSPVYYVNLPPPGIQQLQQATQKPSFNQPKLSSQDSLKQISKASTEVSIKDVQEFKQLASNTEQKKIELAKPLRLQTQLSLPVETNSQQAKPFTLERKKTIVLEESKQRYSGTLKFFDEIKNYGFIVMEEDGSDIFLHNDDLVKANIPKEFLKDDKKTKPLRFSFLCMNYIGRYDRSRKAIDIQLIDQ